MGTPTAALFFLWTRSFANLLRARLRRLKQPKYLLGAFGALGYLYLIFVRPSLRRREAAAAGELAPGSPDTFVVLASLGLVVLFALFWLWRRRRAALPFSEAEIAWLFPGPVSQAVLTHYSFMRTHAAALFSSLLMSFVSVNWDFATSPLWVRFIGWWMLMSVITLHVTASGFTLTRLLNRGVPQWQRQAGVALLLAALAWLAARLDPHLRAPRADELISASAFREYVQEQGASGVLYWLLWPFRALLGVMLAEDTGAFLRALPAALLVHAAHYYWAFKSVMPHNEDALALATRRANILAAARKGNLRAALAPPKAHSDPFRLAARGTPVIAFLWKNLLSTRAYMNVRTFLVLAVGIVAWDYLVQGPQYLLARLIPTFVAFVAGAQVLLFGPQLARQDLRSDMDNADLLKTWPVAGWQVVLGEMLAPVLILTGVLWLCLLQIALAIPPNVTWPPPELRIIGGVAVALVLPLLCGVQLLVANTAAVLFPAWVRPISQHQAPGIEVGIQRLFFFAGQWLATLLALAPAFIFGVLVYIPASWFIGSFALLAAAMVAGGVLAAELAWGVNWLGERFDAYDLSA